MAADVIARFSVPGRPVAKERPRVVIGAEGRSRAYTPAKTKNYEELVGYLARSAMAGKQITQGPVMVRLWAVSPIPASWPSAKRQQAANGDLWPTCGVDLDNICKAILDGMNGIVWMDDSQVVRLVATKSYGDVPCVNVEVESV